VFYIPGFDPMPPRRYRELFRAQSAEQAAVSGYAVNMVDRPAKDGFGWRVAAQIDGAAVTADIDVLVWSDIVRSSMNASIPATYLQLIRTAWVYISTGALWRLMRLRKGPVIAALYPVGMLLLQLFLAFVLGSVIIWVGKALLIPVAGLAGHVAAAVTGLVAAMALLRWFKAIDGRIFAHYLMHDYAFAASCRGANPAELETRMAEFSARIAKALQSDADEVMIVGHSSGASLAISVVADVLRDAEHPEASKLALLTLGQVVPMTTFLPDANRLRADLAYMAEQDRVAWVDVTAPGDGCAFALCDPVAVTGVSPTIKHWPLVLSAAFSQTLSPARWAALRWRFFRLHFQYLCAFDQPGDYDYFQITAGPQSLRGRYAGRAPSPSRIETPVNTYTSVVA
jgi:hypothetical protein